MIRIGRRAFVQSSALVLLGVGTKLAESAVEQPRQVRAGLITDLHYADKPPRGTRYYRETLTKLSEAAEKFAAEQPDFTVELGDFIDAAESVDVEQSYLRAINAVYKKIPGPKHYVLGNHCVDTLTKEEFLGEVGQQASFGSFDHGNWHFVFLDACFREDGQPYGRKNSVWTDANVPPAELDWLTKDLKKTERPTIVFAHQRLDVAGKHSVKNAPSVRKILEESGKVIAVLQGHSHKNDYQEISGIHYATLVAMVEGTGPASSGYSLLDVLEDHTIQVNGFRQQAAYRWS